jgi:ABC-type phosphate transport system substrate-binding protein
MSVRRLVAALAVALSTMSLVPVASIPALGAGPTINGGGSSFAALEFQQWQAEVARNPYNLTVNYVAQGSTFGRTQYISGNFDFAASDIPFLTSEVATVNRTNRKDYVYVPVSAGGLGFMYNIVDRNGRRVTELRLTRRAVCRIFTEPDIRWTDPEIQNANPTIPLPDEFVRPIVRQDGSGTSYVFSEFCIDAAPDVWQAFIAYTQQVRVETTPDFQAGLPTSNWPLNIGKAGSAVAADGVAAVVADPNNGANAITYNEAGFALVRGFPNAYVQNTAGNWLLPTEDNVSVALAYATPTTDANGRTGTFKLEYSAPDPNAYFPSTYSYVIAQTTGFDPAKGEVLARFLCYAITRGQREDLTKSLGYARLSEALVNIGRDSIARIPGAPPWDQCRVQGQAPPPTPTTSPTASTVASGASGGGDAGGGGSAVGGGSSGGGAPSSGGTGTGSASVGGSSGSAGGGSVSASGGAGGTPTGAGTATGGAVVAGAPTALCQDPLTGDPVNDAALCASFGEAGAVAGGAGGSDGAVSGGGVGAAAPAAIPAINPTVADADGGPTGNEITWVLIQGASVCAVGAALAGVRRRVGW